MTRPNIDAIRARLEAATEGNWWPDSDERTKAA